jgi:PAS domain S-box-containing protein
MPVDERVRMHHTSEQYVRSLLRVYGRLAVADSYDAAIDALRSELLIMLGYSSVWLQLVRPEKSDVLMLDCGGPVEVSVKALQADARFKETVHGEEFLILPYEGDPFINEVIRSRDIYVVPDARTHPLTDKGIVAVTGNRTMVCMPLVLAEKTIGCLSTGTFFDEGVMVPDEAQLDYLRQLAHHVAVAIDRVRFLGERREALERLQSTVEELEFRSFLLDSVMDGVIVRDVADMRVLYVNEALCAFAGRTRDELLAMCDVSWICVGEESVLEQHFDCAREAGSDTIETCAYTGIGFKTRVQVRTSIVVYRGREVLMSVVRDISGR